MFDAISSETMIVWESSYPNARETLILDFENSPYLDDLYLHWKNQLNLSDPKGILESLIIYLRTAVFDVPTQDQEEAMKLLKSYSLPLDYFVAHRFGVCRHFSLAAYYFLERARKEQLAHIRSIEVISKNLEKGRHAWLCVEIEDGSFHFDPYWGILESYGNTFL
jgi:hypothetical protein